MIEYGVQFQHEDGSWRCSLVADVRQMRNPRGALMALDHVRHVCPDDTWRLVSREIPDWAAADEDALRATAATEATS